MFGIGCKKGAIAVEKKLNKSTVCPPNEPPTIANCTFVVVGFFESR
jgi:hypothetical protein